MKKALPLLVLLLLILLLYVNKEDTLSENEDIVLGQSCVLSGPSAALGQNYMDGANAYFDEVNELGGVNGRKIKLISMDDFYEPDYAVKNTLELIQERKVFAIFGEVGTPTSKAVIPIITEHKVPFLMPFTGAELLRKPYNKYIINMRSSYEHETLALIEYLVDVKKQARIAVFYQNDSYGKAGLGGVKKALKSKKLALVAEGKYRRNTLQIEKAIINILEAKPDAIVIIGAYKPSATFIKEVKKRTSTKISFANISFVGANALVKELGSKTDNILISQVVPLSDKGFIFTEGYFAAKLFVKAVENAEEPLSRKSFLESFSKLPVNTLADNLSLVIKDEKFMGLNKVYITTYKDENFIQIMEHQK